MARTDQVVLGIIFKRGQTGTFFLLLKRNARQGGFWQPLTGGVEDTETLQEALIREVREETGIKEVVRVVPDLLSHRFYAPRPVHEHAFGVEVRPGTRVKLDGKEHSDARWCTYNEAKGMLMFPSNRTALERLDSILRGETSHLHP
ncbi:MAG: NUDIX pyrophosphatase [Methanomassiliicoccales archaeon]|jgi:dATP pyrophosphohydrolase|nr:NUDIX pyrophosphatase [Methanomassiliicoccales archaeon]